MKLRLKRRDDVDVGSMLSNLHRLEVLADSGLTAEDLPHESLDALTHEASKKFGGLKAQLTLVDDQRQIFASSYGKSGTEAEIKEEPLDYSYCRFVVAYDDVLAVDDSLVDPLVKDNLSTIEHGMRSYLGVPLRTRGQTIGSFCVFDNEPHEWTMEELRELRDIADKAMRQINEQFVR